MPTGTTTVLTTDRLKLRRFTSADADRLFELDADPDVMRFITGGVATPRVVIEKQILPRFVREQDDAGVFGFWAAEMAETFIGWFSLRLVDDLPGEAALGYRLHRRFWGQGLASEGAQTLVARGFGLGSLEKISATTYEDNRASIAVMKKIGMRFQRSFQMEAADIEAMDTAAGDPAAAFPGADVEYAITVSHWRAGRRTP